MVGKRWKSDVNKMAVTNSDIVTHQKAYEYIKETHQMYGANPKVWFPEQWINTLLEHLVDKFKYKFIPRLNNCANLYVNKNWLDTKDVAYLLELYEQKVEKNLNKRLIEAVRRNCNGKASI